MFTVTRAACVLAPAYVFGVLAGAPAHAQNMDMMLNADSTSTTTTTQGNNQAINFEASQPLNKSRIVTVPDAIAPSIAGGNPCVISASMAASGLGFGVSAGLGLQDPECEMRQQVALLVNMGETDVAIARFSMDTNVRKAFLVAGRPCAVPGAAAAASVQPLVQQRVQQGVQPKAQETVQQAPAAVRPAQAAPQPDAVTQPVSAPANAPVETPVVAVSTPAATAPSPSKAVAVAKAYRDGSSERTFKWESRSGGPDADSEAPQMVIIVDPAALSLGGETEADQSAQIDRFRGRLEDRQRGK